MSKIKNEIKKILHITYSMEEGGVDTLLAELLPLIQSPVYHIDILVLAKDKIKNNQKLKKSGINIINGKYSNVYDLRNIFYIRKIAKNYDIIHSHLFPAQYYTIISMLYFKERPRLITTEHCNTNKRRNITFFKTIERYIYNKYDKIIGVCQVGAENLKCWTGLNDKITYIQNGISLSRIENASKYTKSDINLSDTDIVVMMIARFFSQKNHYTAIEAFQFLPPNFKLILIGSGELLDSCKEKVNKLNLNNQIIFMGQRDDVSSLIHIADIGLLSTHFEGLPISLIEFIVADKPIIGTDIDGIKELIEDNRYRFKDNDPLALSNCILAAYQDLNRCSSIKRLNKKRFDISYTASKYIQLYNSLTH